MGPCSQETGLTGPTTECLFWEVVRCCRSLKSACNIELLPDYGVPFLGSSSMLQADLSDLPLLRKQDALSSRLSFLRLETGMTLISCSGTIGKMMYVRPNMAGMWSSQDIIKVVPNQLQIPS